MSPHAPQTDGERWTRQELRRLRDARYTPDAIGRFLAASARRAGEVRSARPVLARQSNAWLGAGTITWGALAAAGCEPFRRRIVPAIAWWAAVAAMLDWHLGMFETVDGEPVPLSPADALTLTRVWLVPALADSLDSRLLAVAAATDVLDGVAARAGRPTRAGRDLEGLADAAVLLAALHAAARTRRLARPVVALEAIRLLAGTAYAAAVYFTRADAPDPVVTRAARGTTPIRVAGLLAAGAGLRRWGHVLLVTGSVASLASLARGVRRRRPAGCCRSDLGAGLRAGRYGFTLVIGDRRISRGRVHRSAPSVAPDEDTAEEVMEPVPRVRHDTPATGLIERLARKELRTAIVALRPAGSSGTSFAPSRLGGRVAQTCDDGVRDRRPRLW